MSKRYFYLTALLILTLNACIKEAIDVNLPEFKQKFVINSFISPSDTASVLTLTLNHPIYGELNSYECITKVNPQVYISDGINEIQFDTIHNEFFDSTECQYKISSKKIRIKEGKNYKVSVYKNGELQAHSSCTVPSHRDFKFKVDTSITEVTILRNTGVVIDTEKHLNVKITLSFTDYPGEENYYHIVAYYRYYYSQYNIAYSPAIKLFNEFISDKGKDGKEFKATATGNDLPIVQDYMDSVFIMVHLLNTDKVYYDYHKSLKNYNGDMDPFKEINPVYSNVSGGLGVFCAYTQDLAVFRLK